MEYVTFYLRENAYIIFTNEKYNELINKLKRDIETINKYKIELKYLYQPIDEYVDSIWIENVDLQGEEFVLPYINIKINTGECFIGVKYSDDNEIIIKEQKSFVIDI